MKIVGWSFNWFDLVTLVLIGVGIYRGRSRGMSEELLDTLKWILIVVICGLVYRPAGGWLASTVPFFSALAAYLTIYILFIILIRLGFSWLKQMTGEKLVGSDTFGSGEYYLGMVAGAVRFACYLIVAMALLNAKYISPEQLATEARSQKENFGDSYFPTLGTLQQGVFSQSTTGKFTKRYLAQQLIFTTAADRNSSGFDTVGRRREREALEVLMDKK
jgi:uncharacterized membrane protein required for colicin V production